MSEREAKLLVADDFQVPPPRRLGKRVASIETDTVRQCAVYYDTPDLRLTRSGVSVRFRSDDGWTVKLPERRSASVLIRSEHAFAGDGGEVPKAAASLVRSWTRSGRLVEVADVDTRRRRTRLRDRRGAMLAELDDDDVVGERDGDTAIRFREIEVELADDTPDSFLDDVVRELRHAGARRVRATSKVARVLGDAAAAPPDLPAPTALGSHATIIDVVRNGLTRSVEQLLAFDPLIRLTDDAEAVHKARVATRRLRSDLRTFRPILDQGWSEPLRTELKWLGSLLGAVRDADVLLEELGQKAARLPVDRHASATALRERLRGARGTRS